MLIVEVVNPIIEDMVKNSHEIIADCEYCQTSTRSVIDANLLLFKTVIAGDSWGQVAVPVIQRNPETAFIFVGSSLSLVFGVLNIIVAAARLETSVRMYLLSSGGAPTAVLLSTCFPA